MSHPPKKKLFYDISAGAVQMLVTQLSGGILFFLLSNYLSKHDIGVINWSLAVLMILYAILGFGMDQVAVKKIATGTDPVTLLKPYLLHMILAGGIFMAATFITWYFIPATDTRWFVFALLALSQFLLFLSVPFKQVANGFEQFRSLLVMSVIANSMRLGGLLILISFNTVSIIAVIYLYVLSSLLELITCIVLYTRYLRFPIRIRWNKAQYLSLINDSLPQLGVIFFTTIIARFDWVLLGILSSSINVADYSFTYRAFELSTLPLLVLGPLLLPRISRLFLNKTELTDETNTSLINFIKNEMLIAVFTILLLNVCWSPLIDSLTGGRYGTHNAPLIFILSLSIPFLYINNILWSLDFAKGKLKNILHVFLITSIVNISADCILIPLFSSIGAAIGFSVAIVVQTALYLRKTSLKHYHSIFWQLIIASIAAAAGFYIVTFYLAGVMQKVIGSAVVYILLLIAAGRFSRGKDSLLAGLAKI